MSKFEGVIGKVIEWLSQNLPQDKQGLVRELCEHVAEKFKQDFIEEMPGWPGYKFVCPFNSEVVQFAMDQWSARDGDVIIASYPKTGTTWLREVVRQIVNYGDEKLLETSKMCEIPFLGYLEAGPTCKYEIVDSLPLKRRVWGTHVSRELVNTEKLTKNGVKIIYIMRNPKDMVVSMKKFFEGMPWMQVPNLKPHFPGDFEGFVKSQIEGNMPMQMKFGEWYVHHAKGWMQMRGNSNFHFVYYENMKKDPKEELNRLCKFLGCNLNSEQIDDIADKTSFDSMKKTSGYAGGSITMFRKGGVGNWKEHFTVALSELVDKKVEEDLGENSGIEFTYQL